ncbi:MAG TPA: hypothetical protein EYQ60_17300 [Myxococcales bacterium]|nr:hypothetical protein [Myxococcales bacterium]
MSPASSWRTAIACLILPMVLFASLELFLRQGWEPERAALQVLHVQPSPKRVYVLGNSIMKTAFDFDGAEKDLSVGIDREIHFGHFTGLWYLLVKNAIVPSSPHPGLIVWGFLPQHARRPAARIRVGDHTDLARSVDEYEFDRIATGAPNDVRSLPMRWLMKNSRVFSARTVIADQFPPWLDIAGAASLEALGHSSVGALRDQLAAGSTLTDLLLRRLSTGELVMPEERINQIAWNETEAQRFPETFVPRISEMILEAKIPQLVVIFRRNEWMLGGVERRADRVYVEEAVRYFKERGIPFLDLSRMNMRYFAKRSHINEAGRRALTPILVRRLLRILDTHAGRSDLGSHIFDDEFLAAVH